MTDTIEPPVPENEIGHRRRVLSLADEISDLLRDLWDRIKEYGELGVPAREWLDLVASRMPARADSVLRWLSPYMSTAIDMVPYLSAKMTEEEVADAGYARAQDLSDRKDHVSGKVITVNLTKARDYAFKVIDESPMEEKDAHLRCLTHPPGFGRCTRRNGHDGPCAHETDDRAQSINLAESFLALDENAITNADEPSTVRMRRLIGRLFAEAPKMETPGKGADADQAPAIEVNIILRGLMQPLSGVLSKTPEGTLKLLTPIPPERTAGKLIMIEQFFDYADVTSVAVQREMTAPQASSGIIISS